MKLFLLFFVFLLLVGCSQVQIYEAVSLEEQIDYHKGKEIVFEENEDVSVWAVFEGNKNEELNFWIKVKNLSENKFDVTPANIYLTFAGNAEKVYMARDPEPTIENIQKDKISRSDGHDITSGLNILLAAANIVVDVSNDEIHNVFHDIDGYSNSQNDEDSDYENSMIDFDNQLAYWENESFRITTLYQNDEIDGYVHFPFQESNGEFKLVIELNEKKIEFDYDLKEIR